MQNFRLTLSKNVLQLGIILLVMVITVLYWNKFMSSPSSKLYAEENVNSMEIYMQKRLASDDRNVFFIETTCAVYSNLLPSGLTINRRQACAIYSTARLNPTRKIILYHSCPLHRQYYERSAEYNKYLLDLPNVFVFHAKLEDLLKGSVIDHIYEGLRRSHYPIEHTADIVRILMVYRYGGAYLDLDFVSVKSFADLPKNFVAAESSNLLANGVFQFEREGNGHEFLGEMLTDLAYNYNSLEWAANGPQLFERTFRSFCGIPESESVSASNKNACGISVTNGSIFFPIYYSNWKEMFEPNQTGLVELSTKDAVAVHFWNFLSKNQAVKIGERSLYEIIAEEYCTKILKSSSDTF